MDKIEKKNDFDSGNHSKVRLEECKTLRKQYIVNIYLIKMTSSGLINDNEKFLN